MLIIPYRTVKCPRIMHNCAFQSINVYKKIKMNLIIALYMYLFYFCIKLTAILKYMDKISFYSDVLVIIDKIYDDTPLQGLKWVGGTVI